jgi:hypothetical protein
MCLVTKAFFTAAYGHNGHMYRFMMKSLNSNKDVITMRKKEQKKIL